MLRASSLKWAAAVLVIGAVGFGVLWHNSRLASVEAAPAAAPVSHSHPAGPALSVSATPAAARITSQPTESTRKDVRVEFSRAADYAQYAKLIRPEAEAGKPDAQYFLSEALRYCSVNLGAYFLRSGRASRTLGEAQAQWATSLAGYQQEILEVYTRCHAYLDEPERQSEMQEWRKWLDESVRNQFPLAQASEADLLRSEQLLADHSEDPRVKPSPEGLKRSRELALTALHSGDPQVLWQMANFVSPPNPIRHEPDLLAAAWEILACNRGYDCSSEAEWVRTVCTLNPSLCNPGDTGQQYLQRLLDHDHADAQRLANEIGYAIDAGKWDVLPTYLWDRGSD